MPKPRVILFEDTQDVREVVIPALSEKCVLSVFTDCTDVLRALAHERIDLVLLDVDQPGARGFDLCCKMKADGFQDIPVMFLAPKGEVGDKLKCLAAGATDYIVKPFDIRELLMHIQVRLGTDSTLRMRRRYGDLCVDYTKQAVSYVLNGKEIPLELTALEFKLLACLAQHADTILAREHILEFVWGDRSARRIVDMHISNLRRKLEKTRCTIKTIYKAGYQLSLR